MVVWVTGRALTVGSACTGSLLILKERTRAEGSWQGDDPDPVAVTRELYSKLVL